MNENEIILEQNILPSNTKILVQWIGISIGF